MSLKDQLTRFFKSHSNDDPSARRRLRYVRLERRLLLSADFGELFATDAEELDADEIDLWADEGGDSQGTQGRDGAERSDERPEVQETDVVPWIEVEDAQGPTIRHRTRDLEITNSPKLNVDGMPQLTRPPTVDPTVGSGQVEAFALTLDLVEEDTSLRLPHQHPLAPSGSLLSDATHPTDPGVVPAISERLAPRSPIYLQRAGNPVLNGVEEVHLPLEKEVDAAELAQAPVALQADKVHDHPDVAIQLPNQGGPATSEQLNAPAIAWLGGFADDLSLMDEALQQMSESQPTEEASTRVFPKSPIVASSMIASGSVGHAIQRTRKQQSQLEDKHCAVRFETRVYPNEQA